MARPASPGPPSSPPDPCSPDLGSCRCLGRQPGRTHHVGNRDLPALVSLHRPDLPPAILPLYWSRRLAEPSAPPDPLVPPPPREPPEPMGRPGDCSRRR